MASFTNDATAVNGGDESAFIPVRDNRGKAWFWADNEVLDVYGPKLGVYAIGVYMVFCRRADIEQKSWPSYDSIADMLGISRPAAISAAQDLAACGLIRIEKRRYRNGQSDTNSFYLTPREEWKNPDHVELPSAKIKQQKRDAKQSKPCLPRGKHGLPRGKHQSKHGLPEVLYDEVVVNGEGFTQSNNNNAEATPVVDNSKESFENSVAQELHSAGYVPLSAARVAAKKSPELCRAWLQDIKGKKLTNPGGYLRKRIESGEMPQGAVARRPEKQAVHVNPDLKAKADTFWNTLNTLQRGKLRADFDDEWLARFRDTPFNMNNPDHATEFFENLIDPKTQDWIKQFK